MKLDILGTEYSYTETTPQDDSDLYESDGYCDAFAKQIVIDVGHDWKEPNSNKNPAEMYKKVKRHEIVHAFLFESGLFDYHKDEVLVEWVAIQLPKMIGAMREAGAL